MKLLDLSRFERDRDYSVWPIDFAMSASFEVPLCRIERILPRGVHAIEPKPGIGLINLSVFSFPAEAGGLREPCIEVICSAHVIPNLSLAPALPRMSMYTFRLGATTREFIESEVATDRYPVFPEPLDIQVDREKIAVVVADNHAQPILRLAAAEGVAARYDNDRFYAQSCTSHDGRVYIAGNLFEFRRAENQRNLQTAGAPEPHLFYGDLDVSGITPKQGYVQMWSEPGSMGCENHFFLKPIT